MSAPTPAERAQVIAGLRELADLLEANPALPVEKYTRMRVSAGDVDMDIDEQDEPAKQAAVDAAAAILGVTPVAHNGHYDAAWTSRGELPHGQWRVTYEVGAIAAAAMAEHELRQSYSGNVQVNK